MPTATKELMVITKQYNDKPVRMIQESDGGIWFVAKDVCDILGLSNPTKAVRPLPTDERGLKTFQTPGGEQTLNVISESGRYRLTMRSTKPEAKPFQDWVVKEVLPSIRKTGGYAANGLIAELEARIAKLERGGRHLLLQPIPEISARARLNMIIRRFVAKQEELGYAYSYPDAWRELYYQYKYRYHEDLRARARNRKCDPLDCASPKELEDLVKLAAHIFVGS